MNEEKKKKSRTLTGTVVSDRMDKTIVVRVDRVRWHKKYGKQYRVSKRYKVHDPANGAAVGQVVSFVAAKPYSREKRWRLVPGLAPGRRSGGSGAGVDQTKARP